MAVQIAAGKSPATPPSRCLFTPDLRKAAGGTPTGSIDAQVFTAKIMSLPEANGVRSPHGNGVSGNAHEKHNDFNAKRGVVRSEGGRICRDFNWLPACLRT
jgi:hypothetical protein